MFSNGLKHTRRLFRKSYVGLTLSCLCKVEDISEEKYVTKFKIIKFGGFLKIKNKEGTRSMEEEFFCE